MQREQQHWQVPSPVVLRWQGCMHGSAGEREQHGKKRADLSIPQTDAVRALLAGSDNSGSNNLGTFNAGSSNIGSYNSGASAARSSCILEPKVTCKGILPLLLVLC